MISDERKRYLDDEVIPNVAGIGPGAWNMQSDYDLSNDDLEYMYGEGGLEDCAGCGWPEMRENLNTLDEDDDFSELYCWQCEEYERAAREDD
jgi:hypothetical protein